MAGAIGETVEDLNSIAAVADTVEVAQATAASEENSALAEEGSASAEKMAAQVVEMSDQAQPLGGPGERLKLLVERFTLAADDAHARALSRVGPFRPAA